MSQNTFGQPSPFGAPAGGGPAGPAPEPEVEEQGARRTKLLIAGGAGLAAIVLASAAALVLTSGGDDAADLVVAAPKPAAAATPSPTETSAPLPTTVEFAGRNPFKAKIVEGAGGGAGGGAATDPAAGAGTGTTGGTSAGTGTTGGTSGTGTGGGWSSVPGLSIGLPGPQGPAGPQGERGPAGEKGEPGEVYVLPWVNYVGMAEDGTATFEVWAGGGPESILKSGPVTNPDDSEEPVTLGDVAPMSWIQVLSFDEDTAIVKLGDSRAVVVLKDSPAQLF